VEVLVDVKLLLNTMKSNETRIGEWLNVIGYVMERKHSINDYTDVQSIVPVQAIVLWSSGPLKLDNYERSLDQQVSDGDIGRDII
jgi:hypothetical protein